MTPRIELAGEASLIVYLGEHSSAQTAALVQALTVSLRSALGDFLVDLTPSYASVLLEYDALRTDHYHVSHCVRRCLASLDQAGSTQGSLVTIPVYYAPESGEDIEALARRANISWERVAEIHSETEYRVYAIGFAPGFAYLGEVDERIAAPRLSTPRLKVPRGAVAIADRQTAVYPAPSPGGWNLIGRSPLGMFDPQGTPPMPVRVGDRVRFSAIGRDEYLAQGGDL